MRGWSWIGAATLAFLAGCASPGPLAGPPADPELTRAARSGRAAFERGAVSEAITFYARALGRARVLDDAGGIGDAAYNLAVCQAAVGQYDQARELLREAAAEVRRAQGNLADILLVEAKVAHSQGRPAEARRLAERVLSDSASAPTSAHRAQVATLLGNLALEAGQLALARAELTRGQGLAVDSDLAVQAEVERLAARIALLEGTANAAALARDREAALWRRARRYPEMARALAGAAMAYQAAGQTALGAERFFRAARSGWAQGESDVAMQYVRHAIALAEAAGERSLLERAAALQAEMVKAAGERDR